MRTLMPLSDPWSVEILAVVRGSRTDAERRALARDVERGTKLRLLRGAYVEAAVFLALSPEDQHIVRMRAFAALSPGPVVFSHVSAAVLHGLPMLRSRLGVLHTTTGMEDERHREGVSMHLFLLEDGEVVRFGELFATGVGRTVVDVAGALPFEEGVMAADAALAAGVPRPLLEAAVDLAGPRRAGRRIAESVAFAHPGSESAAESRWRVTSMRLGMEVPELQHRVRLRDGSSAYLDGLLRAARVGVEVDGDAKYLDPKLAPEGAGRAVVKEKRRQDEVAAGLAGLLRIDWMQSGSTSALRGVLSRAGVVPARPRPTLADHAAEAARARPRHPPARPRWVAHPY